MVTLEGLSVTANHGTPSEHRLVKDVSLKIADKEFCTLIAVDDRERAALLSAIAGKVAADHGRIFLSGIDVTHFPATQRARMVARVVSDPEIGTCGSLTIAENLAVATRRGRWRGFGSALSRRRMRQFFERVAELQSGLEKRLDERMDALPAAQRQALALVMATLAPSSVVLIRDHTAELSPADAASVLDLTRTLAARFNLTVLMATRSLREAVEVGTRTLMLHEGKILFDLSGAERSELTVDGLWQRIRRGGPDPAELPLTP